MADNIPQIVESLYRLESRRILATLIRLLGDFDRAEDALHDAFQAALEKWPHTGVPEQPVAWLISAGRFKGIDRLRKTRRTATSLDALEEIPDAAARPEMPEDETASVEDDRLRLIFTCCHP